jgi:hypothetical protein
VVGVVLALAVGALSTPAGRAVSMSYSEYATRYWAQAYGLDPDWFWNVALCESNGDPYASNGDHYGLFQFQLATYDELMAKLNADPDLAPHLSSFDPEYRVPDAADGAPSAHVAAWAMTHGYGYLWACG